MRTNVLNDLSNVVKKGTSLACSWSQVGRMSEGAPDEHPMSIRSASDGERWKPAGEKGSTRVWKHVAMIFAVLTLSIANIGTAWGVTPVTYNCTSSTDVSTLNSTSSEITVGTGANLFKIYSSNSLKAKAATSKFSLQTDKYQVGQSSDLIVVYVPTTSNNISNIEIFASTSNSRKAYYKSTTTASSAGDSPSTTGSALATSSTSYSPWGSSFEKGTYYSFGGQTGGSGNVYIHKVVVTFNDVTPRTFKSGEKIYFKDQESNFDFDALWKVSSGNVYAYFWNDTENAWSSYGSPVEGEWNAANTIYEITVPGTGKEFTKVLFTRGNNNTCFDCASTWDKTEDQTPAEGKNLFYVYKTKYAAHIYKGAWGNFTPAGKTVYFDNRNVSTWTTAYVRIGHGSNNSAWGAMTKVAGTKYLYSQSTSKYASHTDFAIANNQGWTGGNSIDQPESTYSNGSWSGSEYKMTKQTNFQQYAIENDVYLCPKATSVLEHECQFYQVTNTNSTTSSRIDASTTSMSLPSYTVTSSPTNCTVAMVKYTADDFSASSALASGGTVMPTQYIGVTVTPSTGYEFSSVTLTDSKYEQHTAAAAGVTGKYAILGDCEVSASCTPCTYNITYRDGGDVAFSGEHIGTAPTTHTYNTATDLKNACKAGYVFGGWFDNSSCTGVAITSVGATAKTADFKLYAKWTAMSMVDLASGTFYGASAMVPAGVTVSGTEQYYPGVSSDQRFNLLGTGTSNAASGPMSSKTMSSLSLTNADAVTEYMDFKGEANVTSYVPSSRAVQFKIPAAGQLEIWANSGIYLSNGSTETSISPSTNYATITVAAGTYYLYAKNTSRKLYGIRFKPAYTVTAVTSTGDDSKGTVAAGASTLLQGATTTITATPATGYQVTNWAVSGTGSTISPSGSSSSTTTTLTMGTADATVTVTFGDASYSVTHTLTNVTKSSGGTTATHGTDYTAVFAADDGYNLPNSITVTIGGNSTTSGTEYTWNKATGTVVVDGDYITGAIVITVTGVVACSAPAAPTISGTTSYTVGETITLTASHDGDNHDASTTYTWYKGADWATASAASPVQAAATGSSGYTFTKASCVAGDAGTYWCEASNGSGCESHNSVGFAIDVPLGDDHLLIWEMTFTDGSSSLYNTISKHSTSSYLTTQSNLAVTGISLSSDGKSDATPKLANSSSEDNSKCAYVTFVVADGYQFTPDSVILSTTAVGNDKNIVVELGTNKQTWAQTKSGSSTPTKHNYTFSSPKACTGTVTMKIHAWNSTKTDKFRIGTPIKIYGTVAALSGYDITNGNPSHGTISITDGSSAITRADEDATVHISATPADGYSFTSWSVTKDAGGSVSVSTSSTANPATFTMPAEAVTVTATFTEITHTVNVAAGAHGTVSPSSVSGVGIATASGNITATPAEGYSFNEWTLPDGVTAAAGKTASSNPIQINATADGKTITATWTPTNYTITYTLHDGGEGDDVSGKTSYTIEDDDYDLPTPTWTGHVFLGWYATYSAGVYSDPVSILASGSTGNKTYHAKWADAVPVVWTITKVDDKLYKGGSGYNVKAVVNDAEWSGSASNLALSASDGVTLGTPTTSTVDSKAQIVADFSVGCDVDGDAIAFTLTGPAAGDDAAIEDEKEVNLDECPGGGGTLFSQNFNTATAVAYAANTARAYTKASGLANCVGNADNLFTSMTCNAKGDCGVGVNSTTGGNSASYAGVFGTYNNNTGYYWSLERTTNLASTAPTAVQITFDAYLAVVDNGTSKRAVEFLVGSGFDDGLTNAIPSTSEIYTGFGLITGSSSSKKHAVCKVGSTTLLSSSEVIDYASWKSFTWVINNSGESLTYTSPSGSSETVATGTWDLWVGTNKIVNDQAKNSGSSSFSGTTIQNLYIGSATGVKHEFRLDNVIVTNLGALSSGGIDTDLSWSGGLSDGDDVDKNDVDADFTYTASKSNNSLGEITYSSSNTSVATVNNTGKVHIVGDGSTIITATVAACGCFNSSSISYTLNVANTCEDEAGIVTATNLGCEGVQLTVSGYTEGATIQWYKDGESLGGSYTNATCTVTVAGTYYAVTHKTCNLTSNSVTLAAADDDINPTIFADEFSVKDGRWFGYRLMQLEEGQSWSVKNHPTGWTYETHYRITKDANNILSIEGNVDVASAANKTLTLTITDNCSGTKDVNITIHELVSTAKPTIAWIATGTKGDKTNVAAGESTNTALYKFLKDSFDITPRNCYWTTREDSLVKEYSKYDLIILTDYPNSKSGPGGSSSASTSYTNAIGLLIDHKPILTFEAFVAGCPNWGIPTNPSNTATTQTHLTLLCNAKDIFKDNTDKFAAGEDIEVTTASSGQALQGFPIAYAPDFVFIGKITDSDSKQYVACCERQHEISARMMVFGLNSSIMSDMTDDGKKMVDGFLDYLLLMDPADIPDCSVIFQGGGADNSWYTAANWESGSVPSDPYVTVRIDAPCVIPSHTDAAQAGSIKIHQGGAFTGSLTIQPQGRLIVEKSITRIEGNAYTVHKPTTASDLSIQTNSTGNGVLVMGSHDGTNRATVGFYTKAHKDGSGHWINQFIGTPFYPGNDILQDYYGSYIYEFDPTRPEPVGDENDPRWVNKKKGYHANAFWGYNILRKDAAETTLWMEGQLCSSKSKTLSLYYNGSSRTENMFANSWMAPIDIASMTSAFTNCEATVYILNSGTKAQIAAASEGTASATSAGQYIVLPVASAPWTSPTVKVIPSMQAFSVYATGANAKVTLDYKTMVLDPAKEAAKADLTVATRAPRRAIVRNTTKPDIMRLQVDGEGGYGDVIYMLMRGDFTTGFENGYDGRKMMGDAAAPQMYAVSDAGNMTINCVAEAEGTQIGFKPGEDTHYTFSFAYDGDEELYLNDIKEQKSALISEEKTYEFYVEEGDDVNRFYISHQPLGAPAITTDVENTGAEVPQARKIIYNDKLYIIRGGRVYSAEGALVR